VGCAFGGTSERALSRSTVRTIQGGRTRRNLTALNENELQ